MTVTLALLALAAATMPSPTAAPFPAIRALPCPEPAGEDIILCDRLLPETPPGVTAFVAEHGLTRYDVAFVDLDGNGRWEALVYAVGSGGSEADLCGTGGCTLFVLALTTHGYREISRISVARLPVRVLYSRTHGWHDLAVQVGGGGIGRGHAARLRFDGRTYPSNPTMPPATRVGDAAAETAIATMPPAR